MTFVGWLLVIVDVLLGGWDFYRAFDFASQSNFPETVLYVALATFMAWVGATQLAYMRRRGSR